MGGMIHPARRNHVPFGHHVLEGGMEIGKSRTEQGEALSILLQAFCIKAGKMDDHGRSDKFVYDSQLALVPDLLNVTAKDGLVLFY